jgi:hypothetical protein
MCYLSSNWTLVGDVDASHRQMVQGRLSARGGGEGVEEDGGQIISLYT